MMTIYKSIVEHIEKEYRPRPYSSLTYYGPGQFEYPYPFTQYEVQDSEEDIGRIRSLEAIFYITESKKIPYIVYRIFAEEQPSRTQMSNAIKYITDSGIDMSLSRMVLNKLIQDFSESEIEKMANMRIKFPSAKTSWSFIELRKAVEKEYKKDAYY